MIDPPPIPSELCGAEKPEPPQQGEKCVFLPHGPFAPGHSWEPWSTGKGTTER